MKVLLATVGIVLAVTFSAAPAGAATPHSRVSIRLLPKSGPRTIRSLPGACATNRPYSKATRAAKVTFYIKVTGVRIGLGSGYVQFYADHVPSVAYRHYNRLHPAKNFLGSVPTTVITLCLGAANLGGKKGHHTIYIGVANRHNILYHVRPATMKLDLK